MGAGQILWLFCWANNGMGNWRVASSTKDIFNEIFPFRHDEFLANVGHEYSRDNRYKTSDILGRIVMEKIEQKFDRDKWRQGKDLIWLMN